MEISILDQIDYAFYGNDNYTIDVKDKIKDNQNKKQKFLEVNNINLEYNNDNTNNKFLILKINNSIYSLKEGEKIFFCYDIFKNNIKIIIVRTDRDLYWNDWYKNISKLYSNNKIYVIYNFKLNEKEELSDNMEVIENNKYDKGIYLAYYYILKNKLKGKILILDDKLILNKTFDENKINKSLFTFEHKWKIDNKYIIDLLNVLDDSSKLLEELENENWLGSFKSLSFISYDLIYKINSKHNIENLIKIIYNNQYEMAFERVLGILLFIYTNDNKPIFGDIHDELQKINNNWNYSYDKYLVSKKDKYFNYIFK